jgi:hypothetical protein
MIRLKCSNKSCAYCYSISVKEFEEYKDTYHNFCMICGSKLEVTNLEEIVAKDIYKRAEEYINKWVADLGWDRTLDLIEKNKDQACYRIYKEILEKRGFKIK